MEVTTGPGRGVIEPFEVRDRFVWIADLSATLSRYHTQASAVDPRLVLQGAASWR